MTTLTTTTTDATATDAELVRSAAAGDGDAFEVLFRRHWKRVYGLCLRMTTEHAEAEDLTQETFIQLHKRLGQFRGEARFSTWLHRIAVNQVLMKFRQRETRPAEVQAEEVGDAQRSADAPPHIDRIAIERALPQLPAGYRHTFVLHDVEGFTHKEVGRLLGCSAGTSKSQLHKARLKLRKILNG